MTSSLGFQPSALFSLIDKNRVSYASSCLALFLFLQALSKREAFNCRSIFHFQQHKTVLTFLAASADTSSDARLTCSHSEQPPPATIPGASFDHSLHEKHSDKDEREKIAKKGKKNPLFHLV
jgi:hypothetical protein